MHLVKLFRQYCSGSFAPTTSITSTDIAKARGIFRRPEPTADNIISKQQLALYESYLRHIGVSISENLPTHVPTPSTYNDFLVWQSSTSLAAYKPCQHPQHPANKLTFFEKHCLECMWKIYNSYLQMISDQWTTKSGITKAEEGRCAG